MYSAPGNRHRSIAVSSFTREISAGHSLWGCERTSSEIPVTANQGTNDRSLTVTRDKIRYEILVGTIGKSEKSANSAADLK